MKNKKIIIVGAGLCGTLLAIRMGQRGFEVHLHEKRPDMRKESVDAGRSINLALSSRGLKALAKAGMEADIRKSCIPMRGRMIHTLEGEQRFSPYSGRADEYINSVSRWGLNVQLLEKADEMENVKLFFNSHCQEVDLEHATATFRNSKTTEIWQDKGAVVIGTDGAGSVVRRSLMGRTTDLLFNYSQNFLRHGYKELTIYPGDGGSHRIEKNALHIWPRGSFMIIALPNLDGSFTVTMFHPFGGDYGFDALTSEEKVKDFFETNFSTLIPHMPHYVEEYFKNPVGSLGTIKCYPWQAYGKSLVMGDAAHAIVPFYGQGMNASFEDVRVFDDLMEETGDNWSVLFERFQDMRVDNANAIADLAIDNFHEMQDKVADPTFVKKRQLEMKLEQTFDDYYSKYSLVTFKPDMPYAKAMELGRRQDELLLKMVEGIDVEAIDLNKVMDEISQLHSTPVA